MQDRRVFEMRTYFPAPGRMGDLEERFRRHTVRLFARHGIVSVGYWSTYSNDDLRLVYILAYADHDAREASWTSFRSDPEWKAAAADSEAQGPLIVRRESVYLSATDYSPLVIADGRVTAAA